MTNETIEIKKEVCGITIEKPELVISIVGQNVKEVKELINLYLEKLKDGDK